uniref:Zinc finger, CCHC-type n=1 Tax=Tanacetum cinerariifolium TaxID=118510 RepID=A0A6L2K4S1_TANCI|nr:zinc finger, CCHC-type [Tanacetum cinerariifolium]
MAFATQNTNNLTIRSILLAKKLTGSNFTNWYRNMMIVLRYEKKLKFVEQPIGPAPDQTVDPDTIDKYYESVNLEQEFACLMLSSMSPDLRRTLEKYNVFDMMKELKTMFEEHAKQELFETVKAFHAYKQEDGQSLSSYHLKMKSYLDILERLGYDMPNELGVSLILNSLNKDYDQFVQNYNMHSMRKTIAELHDVLKLYEKGIPKKAETPTVLAMREGEIQKDKKKPRGAKGKGKGKTKLAYAPKPKILLSLKRDNPIKDSICHHCHEVGYLRRNCSSYHAELKKRKNASIANTSGIFTGLRGSRKLKHGALSLYVGNGMHAVIDAIGSFDLVLPSGLIIILDNYHFAPTITRGVVSISHLIEAIRSDRGGKYMSHDFVNHMKSCGIVSQLTLPYTPQHNGVSKRRNETLLDMVRSMMNLKTQPKSFWEYVLESAARILNMVPTKKYKRTPYEIWHGQAPKLSYLRVLGYPKEMMGYYFYCPLENKIFVARNAKFLKNNLIVQEASGSHGLLEASGSDVELELIQEDDTQPSKNTSKIHDDVVPTDEYELGDLNEPPNYKAALSDPESDKWLKAMNTKKKLVRSK